MGNKILKFVVWSFAGLVLAVLTFGVLLVKTTLPLTILKKIINGPNTQLSWESATGSISSGFVFSDIKFKSSSSEFEFKRLAATYTAFKTGENSSSVNFHELSAENGKIVKINLAPAAVGGALVQSAAPTTHFSRQRSNKPNNLLIEKISIANVSFFQRNSDQEVKVAEVKKIRLSDVAFSFDHENYGLDLKKIDIDTSLVKLNGSALNVSYHGAHGASIKISDPLQIEIPPPAGHQPGEEIPVRLEARSTELGNLELHFLHPASGESRKLEFNVRLQ